MELILAENPLSRCQIRKFGKRHVAIFFSADGEFVKADPLTIIEVHLLIKSWKRAGNCVAVKN